MSDQKGSIFTYNFINKKRVFMGIMVVYDEKDGVNACKTLYNFISCAKRLTWCWFTIKARVNSQTAPRPRGRGQTCTKTFLWQVGMCVQNFIKIRAGVWISVIPQHTNRKTNLFTHVLTYYILKELLESFSSLSKNKRTGKK